MHEIDLDHERRSGSDRRSGMDRRVTTLENNYEHILERLGDLDEKMVIIDALRNQIQGMASLVKFVGWGGLGTMAVLLIRYLAKA